MLPLMQIFIGIELFGNSPSFNQRLVSTCFQLMILIPTNDSYIEICLAIKWVKYSCIEVCIPIINKNDMKKEVKSWVNLWMRRGLDLKITLLSMNSW